MVGHPTYIRGFDFPGMERASDRPTILSIMEQDFIPWFLKKIELKDAHSEIGSRDAGYKRDPETGDIRLYQPIHRAFNLVVMELGCQTDGNPRLDPQKVLGAGIVLRRRVTQSEVTASEEETIFRTFAQGSYGWMKSDSQILGWRPVPAARSAFSDPDPDQRAKRKHGKNAQILQHAPVLNPEEANFAEEFAPLYPAPDEVCRKLGKTIFYGYLPVTSSERAEEDEAPVSPFDTEIVSQRLPSIFWSGERIAELDEDDRPVAPQKDRLVQPLETSSPNESLDVILTVLRYLSQEPGLFLQDETGVSDAPELQALFEAMPVTLHNSENETNFYSFLADANRQLIEKRSLDDDPDDPLNLPTAQALPTEWPIIDADVEAEIVDAIEAAMARRWAQLSPDETRFQNGDARYEVSCFARIDRSDCGCPPETIWSQPSDRIEIVPWFEGSEAPPTIVDLPSPGSLKNKVSPNVAFKVPEEIQKFMSGMKLDKLMEGEKPAEKWGFGMICGFSIPIITICAFIVLQIFLSLFHILFWWLPFIRICIPYPKKG